jgi:xanthine dehydrogenase YagS FAD-binding subunit
MNRFAMVVPSNVQEAARASTTLVADAMTRAEAAGDMNDAAVLMAGGVDLLDLMKEGLLAPGKVVTLRRISGLDAIVDGEAGGIRIGAMATLAQLAEHPVLRKNYAALSEAAGGSASPQIRHAATLGGNLLQRPRCWYFRAAEFHCLRKGGGHCFATSGESQYHAIFNNHPCAIVHPSTIATPLVALGATVELTDAQGTVRRVLLENFFTGPEQDLQRENELKPQEILTAVHLPAMTSSVRMAHLKQGEKDSFDWPLADVAVLLDMVADGTCKRATVILGAAAPVPHRARAAEAMLVGQHIDEATARAAARAALEGATPLSKNTYKLPLFETLVRRTLIKAMTST